jgi:hypothetical protein
MHQDPGEIAASRARIPARLSRSRVAGGRETGSALFDRSNHGRIDNISTRNATKLSRKTGVSV